MEKPAALVAEPAARETGPVRSTLPAGVVAFVGWLASSLGAIGAIFYASGFLISAAHLRLLGLGQIVTYSHEHYVQQGGEFIRYVAAYAMEAALLFIVVIVAVVLLLPMLLAHI